MKLDRCIERRKVSIMKVVRISKHNQVFFDLMKTEGGKKQLMEMTKAHNEWLAKLKGEGKFLEGYFMPGSGEAVLIFEAEDEADIESIRLQDPLEITFDMDLRVAISVGVHLQAVADRDDKSEF